MKPQDIEALKPHIKHITWHWSAGLWHQTFKCYHLCTTYDQKKGTAKAVQTLSLWKPGAHVYQRNTGNIAVSLMAMGREVHPITRKAGKVHAIQDAQIEVAAKTTAELLWLFDLPLEAVNDHAHWATVDGYGPGSGHPETRVDVGAYEPILRKKTAWYLAGLKKGTVKQEHTLNLF